jgi:hypothetical protein
LIAFKVVLIWFIGWITKANILVRNLKKIMPPDEYSFVEKCLRNTALFIAEVFLSWINVVVASWQIIKVVTGTLRDLLSVTPEALKKLQFPLKNNPEMSAESVWAHITAMGTFTGDNLPQPASLVESLTSVSNYHNDFDRELALKQLSALNVINSDILVETNTRLKEQLEFDRRNARPNTDDSSSQN